MFEHMWSRKRIVCIRLCTKKKTKKIRIDNEISYEGAHPFRGSYGTREVETQLNQRTTDVGRMAGSVISQRL